MLPEHVLDGRVTHRRRGIQALVDFLRGGHAANIALRAEPDIFQIINNVEATGRDHTGSSQEWRDYRLPRRSVRSYSGPLRSANSWSPRRRIPEE